MTPNLPLPIHCMHLQYQTSLWCSLKSAALQYSCAVSVPHLWPYQVSGIPTLPSMTQTFAERFSVENERHLMFVDEAHAALHLVI